LGPAPVDLRQKNEEFKKINVEKTGMADEVYRAGDRFPALAAR
jgi:hypothetical protein